MYMRIVGDSCGNQINADRRSRIPAQQQLLMVLGNVRLLSNATFFISNEAGAGLYVWKPTPLHLISPRGRPRSQASAPSVSQDCIHDPLIYLFHHFQ